MLPFLPLSPLSIAAPDSPKRQLSTDENRQMRLTDLPLDLQGKITEALPLNLWTLCDVADALSQTYKGLNVEMLRGILRKLQQLYPGYKLQGTEIYIPGYFNTDKLDPDDLKSLMNDRKRLYTFIKQACRSKDYLETTKNVSIVKEQLREAFEKYAGPEPEAWPRYYHTFAEDPDDYQGGEGEEAREEWNQELGYWESEGHMLLEDAITKARRGGATTDEEYRAAILEVLQDTSN